MNTVSIATVKNNDLFCIKKLNTNTGKLFREVNLIRVRYIKHLFAVFENNDQNEYIFCYLSNKDEYHWDYYNIKSGQSFEIVADAGWAICSANFVGNHMYVLTKQGKYYRVLRVNIFGEKVIVFSNLTEDLTKCKYFPYVAKIDHFNELVERFSIELMPRYEWDGIQRKFDIFGYYMGDTDSCFDLESSVAVCTGLSQKKGIIVSVIKDKSIKRFYTDKCQRIYSTKIINNKIVFNAGDKLIFFNLNGDFNKELKFQTENTFAIVN